MTTAQPRLGRWDRNRELPSWFDQNQPENAQVGPRSSGRIQVDCRFLFRKSRWGTLTGAKHPGGIVYLDLDFHQPPDCRLKSATVKLTLDDEDPALAGPELAGFVSRRTPSPGAAPRPVDISHYGPEHICGQPSRVQKTTRHSTMPYVDVGGIAGAGGLGRESERNSVDEARWAFTSRLTHGGAAGDKKAAYKRWASNQLVWTLTENQLAAQAFHSNVVHTAFAFAHGGQPFFMKVEVSGQLESHRSRARDRFRKVFKSGAREDSFAMTLVDFGDTARFRMPLDEMARGLAASMTKENILSIPYQLSDTQPNTSHEDLAGGESPFPPSQADSLASTLLDGGDDDSPWAEEPTLSKRELEEHTRTFAFLTQAPPRRTRYAGALAERRPASPADDGGLLGPAKSSPRARSRTSAASSVTLVEEPARPAVPTGKGEEEEGEEGDAAEGDGAVVDDNEAMLRVLRLCGVLAVAQAILGLLAFCGVQVAPQAPIRPAGANKGEVDEDRGDPKAQQPPARAGHRRLRAADGVAPG